MKVKTISITMSFGNYENISMSADVEDGETVGEAIGKLEAVINEEIKNRNNYHLEKSCVDYLEMHGVRI